MKRIGIFLVVALFTGVAWTSTAHAAASWFKVNVDMVGMGSVGATEFIEYRLTEVGNSPTFTFKRFLTLLSTVKKPMLAAALTAMAAGLPIFVFTDPDDGSSPEIIRLLLVKS